MMITSKFWIAKKRNGLIEHNLCNRPETLSPVDDGYRQVEQCLRVFRSSRYSEGYKLRILQNVRSYLCPTREDEELTQQIQSESMKQLVLENLQRLMNFFSEFSFSPNFRFVNTFVKACSKDIKSATSYIANYFALTDNVYQSAIANKMQSQEFTNIVDAFSKVSTQKSINNRFKLYYGSQGTGKTTLAMDEAENNCTVCHSAMLPSDLMEDFMFDDGKAAFKPSQLCKAMTEGKKIVLDEINLLPFESLRFLQSILDGKESFVYKGQTIEIKDGFQIIGTMNLQVNGMVYALPEPLVDRAQELREFELTAEQLIGAII